MILLFRRAEIERKILTTIRRREGACLHMKMLVSSHLLGLISRCPPLLLEERG
jgi:hypothetical protein